MSHEQVAPADCPARWSHGLFAYCPDCTWTRAEHGSPTARAPHAGDGLIEAARVTVELETAGAGIAVLIMDGLAALGWDAVVKPAPRLGHVGVHLSGPWSDEAVRLLNAGMHALHSYEEA